MKLLMTGDWQLESNPPHDKTDENGRSVRFQENIDAISTLIGKASDLGCTGMVHLGDLTENKNPKSVELEAAASLFTMAHDCGMKIWAVAGNHDGSLFELTSSSFSALALMAGDGFKLFHKIEVDDELQMLAIPYRHKLSQDQVQAEIRNVLRDSKGVKFAVAHYGIQGVKAGPRNLVLPGDYLTAADFLGGNTAFPPFTNLFCGHIHAGQVVEAGPLTAVFPGSPVICDQGERNDEKTFVVYDTVSQTCEIEVVPQPRRWMQVPYSPKLFAGELGEVKAAPWGPDDIVTVTGEYDKPDFPRDTIEAAVKAGLPRPFSLEINVKPRKAVRELRGAGVDGEGGMRDSMVAFMKEKYPRQGEEPGHVAPAGDLVLSLIEEQEGKKFCSRIHPISLNIQNFMTFERHGADFQQDVPTLIYGRNGIGKTSLLDSILWCLTGQTSKGISSAGVVRQEAKEAIVELVLRGDGDTLFRVLRSVKLSKTGKPTQALRLQQRQINHLSAEQTWLELTDGGVTETQALINRLVGGSFNSLRVTNFKFQNDTNPIVRANPADRKKVLTEILGLEPLSRAFKAVTERRQESQRALDAEKNKLGGMVAAYELELVGKDQALADVDELTGKIASKNSEVVRATAEETEARAKATAAQGAVESANRKLLELPNTEADLAAAEQAIISAGAAHKVAYDEKAKRWAQTSAALNAGVTELTALVASSFKVEPSELTELEALELAHPKAAKDASDAGAAVNVKLQEIKGAQELLRVGEAKKAELTKETAALETSLGQHLGKEVGYRADLETAEQKLNQLRDEHGKDTAALAACEADRRNNLTLKASISASMAELQGKDIGKCSRCGQAIDSAHIEKELAVWKTEMESVDAALLTLAGVQLGLMQSVSTKTEQIKKLETDIKERRQLLEQIQADGLKHQAAKKSLAEVEGTCNGLASSLELAEKQLVVLQVKAQSAVMALGQLEIKKAALTSKVKSAAASTQAIELKKQAVEGLKFQLDQIKAEGLEATGVYEVLKLQLVAKRDRAAEVNKANQGIKAELKAAADLAVGAAALASEAARAAADRLATIVADLRVMGERLTGAKDRLERLDRQKAQVDQAKLQLGMAQEKVDIETAACALLDPREGLPVYLIDRQLPFLEDRINLYLAQLGVERLAVELTTLDGDRETLAVLVDNGKSPRLDVTAFSGGQLDRIEIALKWALSDLACQMRGVTFGLLAYDEPTGGLDEEGKTGLINLLFERCGTTCPVTLVVSHDVKLIQSFDNKLQFTQGAAEQTVVQ